MSYYRPSSSMTQPTVSASQHAQAQQQPSNAVASSSRLPLPTIDEALLGVLPAKPAGGKVKTSARAVRRPANYAESEMWAAKMCTVLPFGSCQRAQTQNSMFCIYHACQAMNADGERCGNWVANPRETRFCASGWHLENSRHSHLSDLLARRRMHESADSATRKSQQAAQLSFFEAHFPNADVSPPSSMRSSTSSDGHVRSSPGDSVEQKWGAHGVDRWWEGRWGQAQPRSGGRGRETEVAMAELPLVRRGS